MIILNSRFKFGDKILRAKVIDATEQEKVRINGTEFFERIDLTYKDLEALNLPFEEVIKYGWSTNKPLSSGKYKVTYNQLDYFMSFLDQLDLFKILAQK